MEVVEDVAEEVKVWDCSMFKVNVGGTRFVRIVQTIKMIATTSRFSFNPSTQIIPMLAHMLLSSSSLHRLTFLMIIS